ncbi:hypothetical protein PC129_g24731 [Phytophthora cactorum]|uniref:Uncharacterized protein n=1 Tax=Phytophthora cactorum TaxID=29920 RepID=A0A329S1W4_9STRA|nr:hypothetical protein Pcac1_g28272 [Phytophthora cactorum]KAG2761344.1 hypothetical protein Pcac1_g26741 [Phytophthora cactorum]KAG2793319.1 hypothetical protein PC111_g23085 [Phytophthora cactorum]KAG2793756.1 hypothetical protein PC112_g23307 [Phytophthora cactorum]KAG2815441.1 hypothetical protein PC113_g23204 [Phytophthora cactorum]
MSVDELLNPPEEIVLKEHPTDKDFCALTPILKTRLEAR